MEIAQRAWAAAGVDGAVTPLLGAASNSLDALLLEHGPGSFDFAFIGE
jgi:predicted O-methyltransferase YrrM